jgi:hypothetical protein
MVMVVLRARIPDAAPEILTSGHPRLSRNATVWGLSPIRLAPRARCGAVAADLADHGSAVIAPAEVGRRRTHDAVPRSRENKATRQ